MKCSVEARPSASLVARGRGFLEADQYIIALPGKIDASSLQRGLAPESCRTHHDVAAARSNVSERHAVEVDDSTR